MNDKYKKMINPDVVPEKTQLNIRRLLRADRLMINLFFEQMSPETRGFYDKYGCAQSNLLHNLSGNSGENRDFASIKNGKMTGLVSLWDYHKTIPWLSIVVSEKQKGTGIAKQLMDYAKTTAKIDGKGGILLTTQITNVRAQALYERCGYERLGVHSNGEELYILRFNA